MAVNNQTAKPQAKLSHFIPILAWLPRYDHFWLRADVIAGLTLWGLVVPEAMAYAGIAGLPPQAGLYTLLAALLVYALLGASRHLVVQATSATAALLASSVPGVLIVRVDAQLYYANALIVRDRVKAMIAEMASPPRAAIIDSAAWDEIDVTSTDVITGLVKELHGNGIGVYWAEVHASLLEHGRQTGLLAAIREDNIFPTVDAAVQAIAPTAASDQP